MHKSSVEGREKALIVSVVLEDMELSNRNRLEVLQPLGEGRNLRFLLWASALCLLLSSFVTQADTEELAGSNTLRLGTFGFSSDHLQNAEGPMLDRMRSLIHRVECALEFQDQSLSVIHGALKRIQRRIKTHDIDGFLFALPSAERSEFMLPLVPAFQSGVNLYWLRGVMKEPLEKESLRIAQLKGAAYPLSKYRLDEQIVAYANEPRGLAGLLLRGRVDAVLGTERGFGGIMDSLGVEYGTEQLDMMTFYVMVSKRYLSQHPEFEETFVASMERCSQGLVPLKPQPIET